MVGIVRSDDVRKQNRQSVIATVRSHGAMSRIDIGHATTLSPAAITNITTDLISEGILARPPDTDAAPASRGRPRVALSLNPQAATIGIILVQLNRVVVALADYQGEIIDRFESAVDTPTLDRTALLSLMAIQLQNLLAVHTEAATALSRISVGFQGAADAKGRDLLWSPITACRNLPISDYLQAEFGVPVSLQNDSDMIAVALNNKQPEIHGENFITILLSYGVGMGLFINGKLFGGTRSSGTEFGHMTYHPDGAICRCGRKGCIEAYAGDYAIFRRASGFSPDTPPADMPFVVDLQAIKQRASEGDEQAIAAIEAAGKAIGTGLNSLFAMFDPLPVAIVGRGAILFEWMKPAIDQALSIPTFQDLPVSVEDLPITTYESALPLMIEGCIIHALTALDAQIAATDTHLPLRMSS